MATLSLNRLMGELFGLASSERLEMARSIIDRYDAEFDSLNRRHHALGMLEILLADVDRGTEDPKQLAALVGEAWCEIIDADVEYDLLRGLDLIQRSRRLAKRLTATQVTDGEWNSFSRYVLARWHDGAGRIYFRCGDMQGASTFFTDAVMLAEAGQGRCLHDLSSNLRRAEHDAAAQVGVKVKNETLLSTFERLLADAEEAAGRAPVGLDLPALRDAVKVDVSKWWQHGTEQLVFPAGPLPAAGDAAGRERLRGLSNIEHNLSVVLKALGQALLEQSRAHSERSALYSYAVGDGYRFAQALRHLTDLLENRDPLREAMCHRVMQLPWPRGRWMARQHLATYMTATGDQAQARTILKELLGTLLQQQEERGGDLGIDVDMLRYSAKGYRDAGAENDEAESWEMSAARSMRRAVKTALYRRRFKNDVLPLYAGAIARRAAKIIGSTGDPEAIEEILGLVEETSARELLDTLVARGTAVTDTATEDAIEPMLPDAASPADALAGDRASTRDGLRDDPAGKKLLLEWLRRDRDAFEQGELRRTVAAGEVDPDVAQALRRLTAQEHGPTVVRYFTYGDPPRFAVAVIRDGMIRAFEPLVDEQKQPLMLKELTFAVGRLPSHEQAIWLWTTFLAPIWQAIRGDGVLAQLVIIPAPGMFALPLHVALVPRDAWPTSPAPKLPSEVTHAPLGAVAPLSFTVSATAFVTRQRHLLRKQPFDDKDDLCALVPHYRDPERRFEAGELSEVGWAEDRFHLAGRSVRGAPRKPSLPGSREGLRRLLRTRAEIFVFAGHGSSAEVDKDAEVALELDEQEESRGGRQFLTQYALLSDTRLSHNKWTLLNACVSGTASDDAGRAEVSGFLKAFIAAGAGALTVTLWPVQNKAIVRVAGELLRDAAHATQAREDKSVDIVTRLREIQCDAYREWRASRLEGTRLSMPVGAADLVAVADSLHACPMALYL